MVICWGILLIVLVCGGIEAGDDDNKKKAEAKEQVQSTENLEKVLANLSLYLPSFPSGSEIDLGAIHHVTPRPESPVTLSELLRDTPRPPGTPAPNVKSSLYITLFNKEAFAIRARMSNEAVAIIRLERNPGIVGDVERLVTHATERIILEPGASARLEIPIYEKLWGSNHVESISYRYMKSYIHLCAVEAQDRKADKPQKMILKDAIRDGYRYVVKVSKDNKLTAYRKKKAKQ